MSELMDAVKDLKDTLAHDGYHEGLVAEIAGDWEINPALLVRKFTQYTGKSPSEYTPPKRVVLTDEYLAKRAEEICKKRGYVYDPSASFSGKRFTRMDRELVAVGIAHGNVLIAVDAASGEDFSVGWKTRAAMMSGLRKYKLI